MDTPSNPHGSQFIFQHPNNQPSGSNSIMKFKPKSNPPQIKPCKILIITLSVASFLYLIYPASQHPFLRSQSPYFTGDLRDANFPWNKLCFGPSPEKLKIAVFSKTWSVGADPGGMERHASTLYTALAGKDHEIHVFTAPSDRRRHRDIHIDSLHVHFDVNDHGSVNCSLAFDLFIRQNDSGPPFDYVHTESVSLPHWRARLLPDMAVTWHGM